MRQAVPLFRVRMSQDSKNKFRKKSHVELLHPNNKVFILTGIVRVSGDLKQAAEARDLFFSVVQRFFFWALKASVFGRKRNRGLSTLQSTGLHQTSKA